MERFWNPAELSKKIEIIFRHIYKSKNESRILQKEECSTTEGEGICVGNVFWCEKQTI